LEPRHIITDVLIDGKTFPIDESAAQVKLSTLSAQSIAVTSARSTQVIAMTLSHTVDYIRELGQVASKIPDLYRIGKDQEASKPYARFVDGLYRLISYLEVIKKAVGIVGDQVGQVEPAIGPERERGLLDVLKQMLEAQSNKDWILLAALLEYELMPFMDKWARDLSGIRARFQSLD